MHVWTKATNRTSRTTPKVCSCCRTDWRIRKRCCRARRAGRSFTRCRSADGCNFPARDRLKSLCGPTRFAADRAATLIDLLLRTDGLETARRGVGTVTTYETLVSAECRAFADTASDYLCEILAERRADLIAFVGTHDNSRLFRCR